MKLISTIPFNIATPKTAINPMADGTDTYWPLMNRAKMPPMVANGTFAMIIVAYFVELKAVYSRTKMKNIVSGTIIDKRVKARCWFSNAPPHSTQ